MEKGRKQTKLTFIEVFKGIGIIFRSERDVFSRILASDAAEIDDSKIANRIQSICEGQIVVSFSTDFQIFDQIASHIVIVIDHKSQILAQCVQTLQSI